MNYIENKLFSEIKLGDFAKLKHILTLRDIELFAIMSGDINPIHVDLEFAKDGMFHGVIAHGMWGASLVSTLLGTVLPGPGTIYLSQNLKFIHPIILGDELTITLTVVNKNPDKNIIDFDFNGVLQNGKIAISGTASVISPQIKIRRKKMVMPEIIFEANKSNWSQRLLAMQQTLSPLITAVVHPVDVLSLKGAIVAAEEGIIVPILIGPEQKIIKAAKDANLDISNYQLIATKHSHEAADVAVELVRNGKAEAIMKGQLHTDELMAAVVNKQTGLRTDRRMSHVCALDVTNYKKPLFLTDTALNLFPSLKDKVDIIQNAIDLFQGLGLGIPKVAIISAAETINEKIPSTIDAAALCKMAERGQIHGGILDGPLAYDNAISMESALVKGLVSKVAGDADIIIVPNIEAGNILYKQMTYLSSMESAGIVMGATVPIILTSRGSDELSRKLSCVMALVYARKIKKAELNE